MKYLLAVPVYRYCQAVKSTSFNLSQGTIDPSRSSNVIRIVNNDQGRIFVADRFSSHDAVKGGKVFIAYCWVHLRRDFINLQSVKIFKNNPGIQTWVNDWLDAISMIFKINKERLKCSSAQAIRQIDRRDTFNYRKTVYAKC